MTPFRPCGHVSCSEWRAVFSLRPSSSPSFLPQGLICILDFAKLIQVGFVISRHRKENGSRFRNRKSGSSIYIRDSGLREPSEGIPRHLVPPTVLWRNSRISQKSTEDLFSRPKIFSHDVLIYTTTEETRIIPSAENFFPEGIALLWGVLDL